jgi:hypothetical protein
MRQAGLCSPPTDSSVTERLRQADLMWREEVAEDRCKAYAILTDLSLFQTAFLFVGSSWSTTCLAT